MSKLKVLDRKIGLAGLLAEVELNILNDLLGKELDMGYENGNIKHYLQVGTLELLTRTTEFTLVEPYDELVAEDHSDPNKVILNHPEWAIDVDIAVLELLSGETDEGCFWVDGNVYLCITPSQALTLLGSHWENWHVL